MDLSKYLDKAKSVKDTIKLMKTGEKIILSVAVMGVLGLSDGVYQIIKKDIKEHKEKNYH
jgi:hypothetical protein